MSQLDRRLWPFRPRTSLLLALTLLIGLLVIVAIFREVTGWPTADSDKLVLIGIFALSLLPIVLALVDAIAERGGVIEYAGAKLDFSRVATTATSIVSVPVNIGVPSRAVTDSDTSEILQALREAVTTDVMIIDLKDGGAWWETRLLVLLAGAVRLRRPHVAVFVGLEENTPGRFQGWAAPDALLPILLRSDERYEGSYYAARAAAQQWAMVEPALPIAPGQPAVPPIPLPPPWVHGLGLRHQWMAWRQGSTLPNELAMEQFLAADLGAKVESESRPKGISLTRLDELFRAVLDKRCIEESWPADRQLASLLTGDARYVAITQEGRYQRLLPRLVGLNAVVNSLIQRAK